VLVVVYACGVSQCYGSLGLAVAPCSEHGCGTCPQIQHGLPVVVLALSSHELRPMLTDFYSLKACLWSVKTKKIQAWTCVQTVSGKRLVV